MRILHAITMLELGGAQQNTLFTCRRLAERGHDVVLVHGPGGMLDPEAGNGPFEDVVIEELVRQVAPARDLRAVAALKRLIQRRRPDVVHTHSSKAGILGRLAARLARESPAPARNGGAPPLASGAHRRPDPGRPRVVHSVHGWSFSDHHPVLQGALYQALERLASRWTDHLITVSRADLDKGIRLGLTTPEAGSVIRSGMDLEEFSPDGGGRTAVRSEWGVAPDEVLVVNFSCLKPQKAPVDFVRAAGRAARLAPELRFALVGDGVLRSAVEVAAQEEGIRDRLVLAGWRRDVPSCLRAADAVALTSLWEGLPKTVVQARLAGRPVIATAVNGTPEAIAGAPGATLLRPGDVDGFAAAFVRLAREEGVRRQALEAAPAARRELAEFDRELMVEQQERLYRRLVGRAEGKEPDPAASEDTTRPHSGTRAPASCW